MNKKTVVLSVILMLFITCISFMFFNNSQSIGITLANVEALATTSEDSDTPNDCVAVGGICSGYNGDGEFGHHPGLSLKD